MRVPGSVEVTRQVWRVISACDCGNFGYGTYIPLYGLDVGLRSRLDAGAFSYLLRVRRNDAPRVLRGRVGECDVIESLRLSPSDKVVGSSDSSANVAGSNCPSICGADTSQRRCDSRRPGIL